MKLREFIISVITKYDGAGVKKADKDVEALAKQAKRTKREIAALSKELEETKRKLTGAQDPFKQLKDEAREAEARIRKLKKEIRSLNKRLKQTSIWTRDIDLGRLKDGLASLKPVATAAFGAIAAGIGGLVATGAAVIHTGATFESLRAQLVTVEGTAALADKSFKLIQDFAKSTPFQVDELTESFVKLRVRGVKPSTETLTSLGDLAAAFGTGFGDITDAIAAASRGELDPIEKYVSRAKIAGDKIELSFQGQTVQVERSAEAVTNALVSFGKMEGVQGAMAKQSVTASGMLSNLKDTLDNFFDTVAQLGVLDAFKRLLGTVSAQLGEGQNFAQVFADALVAVLDAVNDAIAGITEDDIAGLMNTLFELAVALADGVRTASQAFHDFVEASGGMEEALKNGAALALALVAAFTGPAGIVVAAGLVGYAIGQMAAAAIMNIDEVNDAIARSDAKIRKLQQDIKAIDQAEKAREARQDARERKLKERQEASKQRGKERLEFITGEAGKGLGPGLTQELAEEDIAFRTRQVQIGSEAERQQGLEAILTEEGRQVFAAVEKAEAKQVDAVAKRARREAKKRGASAAEAEKAAQRARQSAQAAASQQRKAALEAAGKTFAETGSAEAAALAGSRAVAGRGKKGKVKGKKGKQFFDIDKQFETAAKKQAEDFAQRELERLVSTGIASDEAISLARQAGRQRAKELEEMFRKAGKVFDASSKNILDVLGLKGPGSILENRPPPQTLIITISPIIKLIETMQINFPDNADQDQRNTMEDAANQARDAMLAKISDVEAMITQAFALEGKRLLQSGGRGRTIPGVQ